MSTALDLAGWVGGVLGIVAYALVSRGRVAPESAVFQGTNIVAAAMLAVAALHHGALPSAFMNLAWIGFGCQALVLASRRTRTAYERPEPGRDEVGVR